MVNACYLSIAEAVEVAFGFAIGLPISFDHISQAVLIIASMGTAIT